MIRIFIILQMFVVVTNLVACGNTGALYLPEQKLPEQKPLKKEKVDQPKPVSDKVIEQDESDQ